MLDSGHVFTLRSLCVGLCVGVVMCCSNMYFGLQSGWVTMGSIQSALLGFGAFKALQRCGLGKGFSVAENVIIQTTSVAVAMMPLTAGLVSVVPALGLLTEKENPPDGPFKLSTVHLMLWTLAVAFFGAFVAVPLRKQTILKEKLPFPSGSATAKVIQLMHQTESRTVYCRLEDTESAKDSGELIEEVEEGHHIVPGWCSSFEIERERENSASPKAYEDTSVAGDWIRSLIILLISFSLAFGYKILAEIVTVGGQPVLASFPVWTWLGWKTATDWQWVLYPSPGYIGQGMIMGPRTCLSMLGGALTGFAVLGPIARHQRWAPGPIDDMEKGAAGWVLWVSLAIMLADSVTSLAILSLKTLYQRRKAGRQLADTEELDGVPHSWWIGGLLLSTVICTLVVSPVFSMAFYQPLIAVALAAFISILAVRAMGETDLNPASGVGKISQILFAVIAPGKVVANVIAGAIAEAGAVQAGDMMQDFKTAHLLGVPPQPQFFAQIIGSFVSVFVSVGVYALYTTAWTVPSEELPVPSAKIWLDMARLFNGGSLPPNVWLFATIFAICTAAVVLYEQFSESDVKSFLPSGIGFAVGMYVGPRFTIPRLLGSLCEQLWRDRSPATHASFMVIVASGLVLGEGTGAIVVAIIRMFQATV